MKDSSAADAPRPFFHGDAARRLGATFLSGIAIIVAFTWWDAARVKERERFVEKTAVGDTNFFTEPAAPAPMFHAEGRAWTVADPKKTNPRDTQMLRAARDDARGLTLYRPRKQPKPDELFVKIAANGYLRLAPVK